MGKSGRRGLAAWLVVAAAATPVARADEVALDTACFWRCHVTLRPPVFGTAQAASPRPAAIPRYRGKPTMPPDQPWSPLPPTTWPEPRFSARDWWRARGPFYASDTLARPQGADGTSALALLCLRGTFTVTDPEAVKSLSLSLVFRGGLRVYLNGKEVGRSHLPGGEIDLLTLADDYPPEATWPADVPKEYRAMRQFLKEDYARTRVRTTEMKVPADRLVRGPNVLALELHRSALPEPAADSKVRYAHWCTAGLLDVKLTARAEPGAVATVERPPGWQVWNESALAEVEDSDWGDPHEALQPMCIVGARNGVFSGLVVVGSPRPIEGLRGEMSELRTERGDRIDTGAGQVRFAVPNDPPVSSLAARRGFDVLLDQPRAGTPTDRPSRSDTPASAVQPVWVTVRVPRDAAPGEYAGALTLKAEGADPVQVPVHLSVSTFTLPDPSEFVTFVDLIESPETLALHYKTRLWSDGHLRLVRRSFELLGQVGSRAVYLPLICGTHFGNTETMVRWVKREDGGYDHDFSLAEKYLDAALAGGMRPTVVCLYAWDLFAGGARRAGPGGYYGVTTREARGVRVTRLDPVTGKTDPMPGPAYANPEAAAFWKPVAEGLRERLKKRGLDTRIMLGISMDFLPSKEVVGVWRDLLPEAPWVAHSHPITETVHGVPVGYCANCYFAYCAVDPAILRTYGWKRERLVTEFPRGLSPGDPCAMVTARLLAEWNVQGSMRGFGRLNGDFWPVLGQAPRMATLVNRFPDSNWILLSVSPQAMLAPGPTGAVPTVRFEMLREGLQECETRIFIEKALTDERVRARLGDALARRCQAVIDERVRYNLWIGKAGYSQVGILPGGGGALGGGLGNDWYAYSGWQERSAALFDAAAEVAAAQLNEGTE